MDISFIIVTWNCREYLAECLDSLKRWISGVSWEVIIVDNHSSDGTVAWVQGRYAQWNNLRVIANSRNEGFARANNIALKQASGKYLFLLNPDTKIDNNITVFIQQHFQNHPSCGIVGPGLLHFDGSFQHSVRKFPQLCDQALVLLKVHNFLPALRCFQRYANPLGISSLADARKKGEWVPVDQVMGAALCIRRETFLDIGPLDSRFWRNFEEVDWCFRARRKRWEVHYLPSVQVYHHKGASFSQVGLVAKQARWAHDVCLFFLKHRPFWQTAVLALLSVVSLFEALILSLFLRILPSISRFKRREW